MRSARISRYSRSTGSPLHDAAARRTSARAASITCCAAFGRRHLGHRRLLGHACARGRAATRRGRSSSAALSIVGRHLRRAWPASAGSRPASGRTSCAWSRARSASSSARRAKPSAAAATEVRNTSSVRIATLKPSPASPMRCAGRHAAIGEAQARQRMRRDHVDALGDLEAGRAGVDDEGARCRARPAPSPVRANTT